MRDCEPVPAGGPWNTLPEDVTADFGDSCDVVIRFGFGLLKGAILDAPEHGVLSVHTSDIREYRGMGHKISFMNDDPSASITLQQLSEEIDGGRIVAVMSHDLPPQPTLDDVWDRCIRFKPRSSPPASGNSARGSSRSSPRGWDRTTRTASSSEIHDSSPGCWRRTTGGGCESACPDRRSR